MLRPPLQQVPQKDATAPPLALGAAGGLTASGPIGRPLRSIVAATSQNPQHPPPPRQTQHLPMMMMPRLPSENNISLAGSGLPLSVSSSTGPLRSAGKIRSPAPPLSSPPPPPPTQPGMISQFAPLRTLKPLADATQRLKSNHRKSIASIKSIKSYMTSFSVINRKNLKRFGKSKITFLVVNSIVSKTSLRAETVLLIHC